MLIAYQAASISGGLVGIVFVPSTEVGYRQTSGCHIEATLALGGGGRGRKIGASTRVRVNMDSLRTSDPLLYKDTFLPRQVRFAHNSPPSAERSLKY